MSVLKKSAATVREGRGLSVCEEICRPPADEIPSAGSRGIEESLGRSWQL